MKNKYFLFGLIAVLVVLFSGCSGGSTGATVSGTLSSNTIVVEGAEVVLDRYDDKACVDLAESSDLSESEKQELEDCRGEYASMLTGTEGGYSFTEVDPGWYRLSFEWEEEVKTSGFSALEYQGDFLVMHTESTVAALGKIFRLSGRKSININFDYQHD